MTTRNAGAATRSSEGSGCWPAAACGRKPETLALKTTRLKEKLAKLESEMQRLAIIEKQMLTSPDQQISLTDPDSRSMATSGRSGVVGYNVQVAVDTKHHLIVTHEVTNVGTDQSQLANMAKETKTTPKPRASMVIADRGYFSSGQILACEEAGITVTLPKPMTSNSKTEGRFGKQDFRYVVEEDVYICPAGERLGPFEATSSGGQKSQGEHGLYSSSRSKNSSTLPNGSSRFLLA